MAFTQRPDFHIWVETLVVNLDGIGSTKIVLIPVLTAINVAFYFNIFLRHSVHTSFFLVFPAVPVLYLGDQEETKEAGNRGTDTQPRKGWGPTGKPVGQGSKFYGNQR